MTGMRGWGFAEQHLALDALVAFVDGELTPHAYDRAASHVASCPSCAAEAAAQRQARAAVRSAAVPSVSPELLRTLQSIPSEADLPSEPDGLALDEDGQLVAVARPDRVDRGTFGGAVFGTGSALGEGQEPFASNPPLGSRATPSGHDTAHPHRRGRHAGVMFSGLMLGTLALVSVPVDEVEPAPYLNGSSWPYSAVPANATEAPASDTPRPAPAPQPSTPVPAPAAEAISQAPVPAAAPR
ncbi:zf-HC2 domain-containing protein [Allosaccharopolyspora coralli]|uniref:Zf-HC2 domain-containing protein n=1 Tax=Allosaccharopolyspora coralli TaxID=2665642 RepID=A0A5Q3Q2R4_9PSEU|nr:zf-HC2 domain-containing protein [Allosaccharopolyspora coralli]QGK68878.1 zf-HC2 domain-containing protein [Allosaccharopolyspora coralli]